MVATENVTARVENLIELLETYLPAKRIDDLLLVFNFAERAHKGQMRKSGDLYITHPLAVATLLAEIKMDYQTIAASLLHDVIEDCGISTEQIKEKFGKNIADLVEGATKIEKIPSISSAQTDAETLRKMFLAMAEDVRVVIIKLADRLHNMRTLEYLSVDRQKSIAEETREIYAPLASRLGITQIQWELEDLSFRYLDPDEYSRVAKILDSKRSEREKYVRKLEIQLFEALESAEIKCEVQGRAKHLYSIFEKEQRYEYELKGFDEIHDLLALRVIVDSIGDCYAALGIIHQTWRPTPSGFDDYIANPKESLYQSLHTSVHGPEQRLFEVQIRTREMHEIAEYGVAAHWQYKSNLSRRDYRYEERMSWLRHLIEWQQEGTEDFLESIKTDVFVDQVFVHTPKGEVLVLPRGSTPIDFAYRIHTDLGHSCGGAKINGKLVPLSTTINNGDSIEIIRSHSGKGPSRDWLLPALGYLGSNHSRQKVRQWFRRQQRDENIDRGKELFDREMRRLAIKSIPSKIWENFRLKSQSELYMALGSGDVSAEHLGLILSQHSKSEIPNISSSLVKIGDNANVRVLGSTGLHINLGKCCSPLPGDPIMGFVTRGGGVTVHRTSCNNLTRVVDDGRLLECDWGMNAGMYSARVQVIAWDRIGLLRDISTILANGEANMIGVRTDERKDRTTAVNLTVETEGGAEFVNLLSALDGVRGVISVQRIQN
tara:strand:+ start:5741 stop:7888 length:2148 start_codon:yes stop_codon:yes gene_type:complete